MAGTPADGVERLVTVVIPTKDRAEFLGETLRSVREQTLPPAAVIVADDGSNDDTERVVREAGALRIHNAPGDWGPAKARNAALARVDTEYVAFLDSDDLVLPSGLQALVARLSSAPGAPFAFGQGLAAMRTPAGWSVEGLIGPTPDERRSPLCGLFARNSVPSAGALVRTAAAREIGGYDEAVTWAEDHHLWVRLALLAEPAFVQELVCIHRRHPGNRHTPAVATADADAILALANADARLAGCLPDRLGIELAEVSISMLRERPLQLPATARRLLGQSADRLATLRRSALHWRTRRRSARDGRGLWQTRADLRDWLSTY